MKRRLICILLTVCMLLGTAALFSSCAEMDGEVALSGSVELDLAGYAVVYAESAQKTPTYKAAITDFAPGK